MKKSRGIIVVIASLAIQLVMGTIFMWSLFNIPFTEKFGWDKSSIVFTFSVMIFFFTFSAIFGGRLQDKYGPRKIATIGSILFGAGVILSSTASEVWQLYLYYGVIAGIGAGFVYVCPVATCVKWFPDKRGLVTGLAVSAFGLSALVFKPIAIHFINVASVPGVFLYLGIIYTILAIIPAQFLSLPDEEVEANNKNTTNDKDEINITPKEMLSHGKFYVLAMMYLFGGTACLTVIGLARDIGVELANITPEAAANAVAVISLFNAGGRLFWGMISDKLGIEKSAGIIYIIMTVSMAYTAFGDLSGNKYFIVLGFMAISYGGMLTIFPTIMAAYYGTKNFGVNYGIIFAIYGLGAVIGPMTATAIGLKLTFIASTILCFIAVLGALYIYKNNIVKVTREMQLD
ncbi:OFA family MFS transporter [Clostridium sardiniense]|uniref:OFA family MFS transporter n=1 Tax=Clostridium sardiniense TaxID=29369 RepID=A0ABS7KU02_CLOSR|nr:OFA family MFS transporter [Clostridium sardiniense]MBY0754204.1 OFA family MFS transporter [Clostridium sardiniense]MDQ0461181.1 OFA family oxalate/formate antiporter-like MFS transporter [Clostridium sardiniense]